MEPASVQRTSVSACTVQSRCPQKAHGWRGLLTQPDPPCPAQASDPSAQGMLTQKESAGIVGSGASGSEDLSKTKLGIMPTSGVQSR